MRKIPACRNNADGMRRIFPVTGANYNEFVMFFLEGVFMNSPGTAALTVIIPAYNDAGGLARVLDELLPKAKEHNWRIIVVNDASTDDTRGVLQGYADRITVIEND